MVRLLDKTKYSDNDLSITLEEKGRIIFSNRASNLGTTTVERIFYRYYTVENARKSIGVGIYC